jgi:hypothetical protein
MADSDADLRALLGTPSQKARDLRHGLIRDHADRDAIASLLMRYRDENGQRWADIIDLLTMYPDAGRRTSANHLPERRHAGIATVRSEPAHTRCRTRT